MKKPLWVFIIVGVGLAVGWLGYMLAGESAARLIAKHFGNTLLRLGQGKFTDPVWFVYNRLREALWLATAGELLAFTYWCLALLVRRRFAGAIWQGVVLGVLGFVMLNLWAGAATNTALFWGVLGVGGGLQNLMQFQMKRILLEEEQTPMRAVLMGNSQTRAEIKEELLNQAFGTNLWTTELHFPGAHGYDLLLLEDQIEKANPQIVICYLTEGYFYDGSHGQTPPNFLGWRDLPELWRLGGERYLSWDEILSGLLGDICPLFRCREVFVQRFFGPQTAQLKQMEYNQALEPDLRMRAEIEKSGFHLNAESDFQKQAFEVFVARCRAAHRRVILLEGGFNPLLERQIAPAVHSDMLNYLESLKERYANVTLIPASALPAQMPADYVDLDHVTEGMQRRFTLRLADLLRPILAEMNDSGAKKPIVRRSTQAVGGRKNR
jgi:hypothetical protein